MAHLRKAIRNAIVARLAAAGTIAGTRVLPNRATQLFDEEIPCILVYTKNEPTEISCESPREYKRNLVVTIELVAQGNAENGLDDTLDDFQAAVESAIFESDPDAQGNPPETFGGLVTDSILGETEVAIVSDGKKPIGALKFDLTTPYYQRLPGDSLASDLDDFETADVVTKVSSNPSVDPAEDVVDLT